MLRVLLVLYGGLVAASAQCEEVPLKSVWAAHMPDARNIRELEPRTQGDNREFGPLMDAIYRTMQGGRGGDHWGRPDAGPGFPVPGEDIAALNATYDILIPLNDRPTEVSAGKVSLVFFSRRSSGDCYLEKVTREGNHAHLQISREQTSSCKGPLRIDPIGNFGAWKVRSAKCAASDGAPADERRSCPHATY